MDNGQRALGGGYATETQGIAQAADFLNQRVPAPFMDNFRGQYPNIPPQLPTLQRPITIHTVLNGFTVQLGCQTIVFESAARLLAELGRYLDNPAVVEKEYLSKRK